jgi:hypothetical protein
MRMILTLAVFSVTFLVWGCEYVDDSDYAIVQKVKGGQFALIKADELSELKRLAELGKGVGRYQIHREGWRTWRLDTATGGICLLLTSDSDWKDPKVSAQGCYQ